MRVSLEGEVRSSFLTEEQGYFEDNAWWDKHAEEHQAIVEKYQKSNNVSLSWASCGINPNGWIKYHNFSNNWSTKKLLQSGKVGSTYQFIHHLAVHDTVDITSAN